MKKKLISKCQTGEKINNIPLLNEIPVLYSKPNRDDLRRGRRIKKFARKYKKRPDVVDAIYTEYENNPYADFDFSTPSYDKNRDYEKDAYTDGVIDDYIYNTQSLYNRLNNSQPYTNKFTYQNPAWAAWERLTENELKNLYESGYGKASDYLYSVLQNYGPEAYEYAHTSIVDNIEKGFNTDRQASYNMGKAVKEHMDNSAPLVGGVIYGPMLAHAVGVAATEVAPALIKGTVDAFNVGVPFYSNLAKDALIGTLGSIATNEYSRAFTGKTLDEGVSDQLQKRGVNQLTSEFVAPIMNPGGWLTFGTARMFGNEISNGAKTISNNLANRLKNIYYRHSPKRIKDLAEDATANFYLINEQISNRYALLNKMQHDYNLDLERAYLEDDLNLKALLVIKDLYTRSRDTYGKLHRSLHYDYYPGKYRSSFVDFTRAVDPTYNPNALDLRTKLGIIERDGNIVIPSDRRINYELKSGEITIPQFGTDKTVTFNIPDNYHYTYYDPVENLSQVGNYQIPGFFDPYTFAEIPKEYRGILSHNIDYVTGKFPKGTTAVYGSSSTVSHAGLPHATNDIDLYILDSALADYEAANGVLPWKSNDLIGLTKELDLDNGMYGKSGKIDLNIVKTKPDGTLDFTSERSLNLFRQLFPDEYHTAVHAAGADVSKMHSPIPATNVMRKVSPLNTIMDAFESDKPKHLPRALWYLNHGDPDQVYSALLKHGESLLGTKMLHAPVNESMFMDPQQNLKLLKNLKLNGLENLETIANDPKRMKLIFEYWWLNNTILSRGTSIENMPLRRATELNVPHELDFGKYGVRNMTEWSGGVGENFSGTGLNTVLYGDSYGGATGNHIYGNMQPSLNGYRQGLSPEELVTVVRNNYPLASQTLPQPINFKGRLLMTYQDILDLQKNITPAELDAMGKQLNIRGITGGDYGRSIYVGVTSPINRADDIVFINPASGRHGLYPHATNSAVRRLKTINKYNDYYYDFINTQKHYAALSANSPHITYNLFGVINKLKELLENALKSGRWASSDAVYQYKGDILDSINKSIENEINKLRELSRLRYRRMLNLNSLHQKAARRLRLMRDTAIGGGALGLFGFGANHLWNRYIKENKENEKEETN